MRGRGSGLIRRGVWGGGSLIVRCRGVEAMHKEKVVRYIDRLNMVL